jgi:hypothetical protein
MAYTLTDPFRPLRGVLRLCGGADLLLGAGLLFAPHALLPAVGLTVGPLWSVQLAGGLLLVLGVYFLLAAAERLLGLPAIVTCALGNGVPALILLFAYLRQDLAGISWLGQAGLILLFIVFLIGAVTPLRYLRAEYRVD